jgi:hypothetical protein
MKVLKGTKLEGTRVDQSTTPKWWKKVRNIAGIVAGVTGTLALTIASGGLAAPLWVAQTVNAVAVVSGIISGRAALAKK